MAVRFPEERNRKGTESGLDNGGKTSEPDKEPTVKHLSALHLTINFRKLKYDPIKQRKPHKCIITMSRVRWEETVLILTVDDIERFQACCLYWLIRGQAGHLDQADLDTVRHLQLTTPLVFINKEIQLKNTVEKYSGEIQLGNTLRLS